MNLIVWIVAGGVAGWFASFATRPSAREGLVFNISVGVVGALLGGRHLGPLLGGGNLDQKVFSVTALLAALVCAIALLTLLNLPMRRAPR